VNSFPIRYKTSSVVEASSVVVGTIRSLSTSFNVSSISVSSSIIEEKWTFLSSTFSGESIAIFVNGTKENTKEIIGVPALSVSGKLETTTVENISSEEDIVVGATVTTKNQNSTPSNQFSGEIDDVLLYDYVLEDEQILAMYEQTNRQRMHMLH